MTPKMAMVVPFVFVYLPRDPSIEPLSVRMPRMAVALWSSRTPGAAQLDRDRQMMNNKKKVEPTNPLNHLPNSHHIPDICTFVPEKNFMRRYFTV